MFTKDIWSLLVNATVSGGQIHLGKQLDIESYTELCTRLRNDLIDGNIPFYKIIAVRISTSRLKRVVNMDKNTDRSYLGMIPVLQDIIIMPENPINTFPGSWDLINNRVDRVFNPTNKASAKLINKSDLLYVRSFDSGEQYADSFKFTLDKDVEGISLSTEKIKSLIKSLKPIIKISEDETMPVVLEMVYAKSTGVVDYPDIDKTLRILESPYLPVRQVYNLSDYIGISLTSNDTSIINLTYLVDIDESVLQCIIRNYGNINFEVYNGN